MTNYKMIFKAIFVFFGLFFMLVLLNYILPPILTVMESLFSAQDLAETIWVGVIMISVLATLVVPNLLFYQALTEAEEEQSNKFKDITIAILIFIFSLLITYRVWDWFKIFANMLSDTALLQADFAQFTLVLYWLGLIIVWVEISIITPAYLIIKNMPNPGQQ